MLGMFFLRNRLRSPGTHALPCSWRRPNRSCYAPPGPALGPAPAPSSESPPASNLSSALRFAAFVCLSPLSESDWLSAVLATLLARLVALLVGILLGFLVLAVEEAADQPRPGPNGRSHPGIAGHRTDYRPSRRTPSATNQGALLRL